MIGGTQGALYNISICSTSNVHNNGMNRFLFKSGAVRHFKALTECPAISAAALRLGGLKSGSSEHSYSTESDDKVGSLFGARKSELRAGS